MGGSHARHTHPSRHDLDIGATDIHGHLRSFVPLLDPHRTVAGADLAQLANEAELKLARQLGEWPRLVEIASNTNEPHRIAFYLYELASDFHSLWNRGNDDPSLRFIQEGNAATSAAKIALVRATGVVIAAGLGILGVKPAQEMR